MKFQKYKQESRVYKNDQASSTGLLELRRGFWKGTDTGRVISRTDDRRWSQHPQRSINLSQENNSGALTLAQIDFMCLLINLWEFYEIIAKQKHHPKSHKNAIKYDVQNKGNKCSECM